MMTLPTVSMTNRNIPLDSFLLWAQQGNLVMDQSYQRGQVWGLERKRNLLRSIRMGLPIGIIFINARGAAHDYRQNSHRLIVDGKQRVSTLLEFASDGFSIPSEWWDAADLLDPSQDEVTYSDLSECGRSGFGDVQVAMAETLLKTEDEERTLFDLVNFGGVPQGEADPDALG